MARPRPSVPVLVLAAVVLVAGVLIAVAVIKEHGTPTGSSSDAAMNQKIIDTLRPYPGARQTQKFVRESYGDYGGGLLPGQSDTSHTTTIVYSMPTKTKPKQIVEFYRRQLPGWQEQPDSQFFCAPQPPGLPGGPSGGPCSLRLTKGEAMLSLDFNRQLRRYSLGVNARGAHSFSSFSD
jgi:hypothetical protein